jgi:ABC-type dipeptide/oligopeptide/nickel transport system ATPase component
MSAASEPLLDVRDLRTVINTGDGPVPVVNGATFQVEAGETVALVGESGCGKSMTMLSVIGLQPSVAEVTDGEVIFDGTDLVHASSAHRQRVRGADIAMVYQDPMTSLNPLMRIGDQIAEVLTVHGRPRAEARARAREVLGQVGIPRPERAAGAYPHEFSGGMRQRVVIAMALAMRPKLLIADEPTTSLDVTIQQQIISLVHRLQQDLGMAVVWITHDLGVVARTASRMLVMYAGHLVEHGPVRRVFGQPEHP